MSENKPAPVAQGQPESSLSRYLQQRLHEDMQPMYRAFGSPLADTPAPAPVLTPEGRAWLAARGFDNVTGQEGK